MMLPCPLYQLTGLQCPFCGVQRSVVALFEGQWAAAWWLNPMFWLTSPYLLLLLVGELNIWGLRSSKLCRWASHGRTLLCYALLMLLWGVVRNVWL